jgi:hypothetical protein
VRYIFASSKPQIVDVGRAGSRAQVFALVTASGLDVNRAHAGEPVVFSVVQTAGGWKLADDAYVVSRYRAETGASP